MSLVNFSLGDVGSVIKDLREAITGEAIADPNKKAELLMQLKRLEQQTLMGQMAINKAEASSGNKFASSWRPLIGYIGGFALLYEFIITPTIMWYCELHGIGVNPPVIDSSILMNLVVAMLGLGSMRTYEKARGIHNNLAD